MLPYKFNAVPAEVNILEEYTDCYCCARVVGGEVAF